MIGTYRAARILRVFTVLLLGLAILAPSVHAQEETPIPVEESPDFQQRFNDWFETNINKHLENILFFPIYETSVTSDAGDVIVSKLPLIVVILFLGGIFFTFRYGFINVRLFRHSIDVIRGRYDKPEDKGEVSHFQALTSALSATVGLGNISGVAIAITMGGPGAVFWMWMASPRSLYFIK